MASIQTFCRASLGLLLLASVVLIGLPEPAIALDGICREVEIKLETGDYPDELTRQEFQERLDWCHEHLNEDEDPDEEPDPS